MKVLYFIQHFSTPSGSVGLRPYQMAKALLAAGHSVTMVCGSFSGGATGLTAPFVDGRRRGNVEGIDLIELEIPYSNADRFARRIASFFRFALRSIQVAVKEDCDVVFASTTPLTSSIPGMAARWLRGRPFVFEVRDLWPELPRAMGTIQNPLMLAAIGILEWMAYRSAHRLIGLSPGIVKGIERLGVRPDYIALIPNGCDLDIFTSQAASWRPEGVAVEDLMAVFAGTHGIANGLDAVLDGAAELKRRGRYDIKLVLIGDGRLKPNLQARAAREGLNNVIFHAPVDKRRLAGLIEATDVGLQILANVPAFYYGTSPNKFFDYISAGRPVLINYPGWLADIIVESHCGFAVPPECPSAFADALERAAADRLALKAIGQNALQLARERFDRRKLTDQFVKWLEAANQQ